jgi:hypothetical protein
MSADRDGQPFDETRDIAITDHHSLRYIGQRHAFRNLVELCHQIKARQRNVEPFAQATTDLALDQGRTGQETKPQTQLVTVIFRQFDDFGLGIKNHFEFIPASRLKWHAGCFLCRWKLPLF